MKQILRLYKVLMCWDLPRPEVHRNVTCHVFKKSKVILTHTGLFAVCFSSGA